LGMPQPPPTFWSFTLHFYTPWWIFFSLFGLASSQAMNRYPNKWVRLKGGYPLVLNLSPIVQSEPLWTVLCGGKWQVLCRSMLLGWACIGNVILSRDAADDNLVWS
jgi:hypothetical protein